MNLWHCNGVTHYGNCRRTKPGVQESTYGVKQNQSPGTAMTFIRLLKLTEQGIQAISKQKEAYMEVQQIIEDNGGKLVGSWFTQGEYDLISIIDAEDEKSMRTISARLAVKGLYTGKTLPAMTLEDFMGRFGDGPEVAMFLETWFRSGRKDRRR
jgi:uncharacterized protein with GYD domain